MYLNKIFKPTTGRTNKLTCWLISFLFSNRRMTLFSTAAQRLLLHHDRTEVWEHLWRGRTVTSPGVHVSAPYSQSRPEAKPTRPRPRCLWSRGTTRHWISVWESASAPLPWAPENTSRKGWSPLAPSTWSFHSPPLQDERRGANAGSVVSARLVSTQFRYGFWDCVAHCLFVLLLLSVRGLGALVISSLSFNTVLLQGACQIAVMAWVL